MTLMQLGFAGAFYKGTAVNIKPASADNEAYRVFVQGATGFVSMSAVRADAEERASSYCRAKGKQMEALTETTADPPYVMGNFPRIEIVFDCIATASQSVATTRITEPKYQKIVELKKLLDGGAITQAEFDSENEKVLAQP